MKKQQSFFIFKFESDRLRDVNYNLHITFAEAQRNLEIVRLADNQVLRTLREVKKLEFSGKELYDLLQKKKKITKLKDTEQNKAILFEINQKIESILFVPEIVSIHIVNKAHYQKILKNGLFINGEEYVRFLSGAGNIRRNTVNFIQQRYFDKVNLILDNGRNLEKELVPAKFNAYFGLYNSASLIVDFPSFIVLPDLEVKRNFDVKWVSGVGKEIKVEELTKEFMVNCFDGQGLISPELMRKWSENIGLDYVPSWSIIRAPFIKGNVVTFDFKGLAEAHNVEEVTDAWGSKRKIKDYDLILSVSQFKLYDSYKSLEDFLENCNKNNLSFGITRYAPSLETEKDYVFSNYQFTQVLDLQDNDIENFCKPTVDHVKNLYGFDANKMSLFLLGSDNKRLKDNNADWFYDLQDPVLKALMIDENVANDSYVRNHFVRCLNKTIKEAKLGATIHHGNFSALIVDPYAQAEHFLGLEVVGLLGKKQYYSNYWNNKNVEVIAGCRAPLTHYTEVNVMPLLKRADCYYWYNHITSGIILPYGEIDTIVMADSD